MWKTTNGSKSKRFCLKSSTALEIKNSFVIDGKKGVHPIPCHEGTEGE
jgi:hypothetical protein